MDDHDSDGADFSVVHDRPSLVSPETARLLIAAGVGVTVGAAVSRMFDLSLDRNGDEAPIRVKGGSIHCEVLSDSVHWEEDGNPQKWKLTGGMRRNDTLVVIVGITDANDDTHSKTYVTKRMRVHYAQSSFIQFTVDQSTVNEFHTKIFAHDNLKQHSKDPRLLRLERKIESIRLQDHGEVYHSGAGKLDFVLIVDQPRRR